MLPEYLTDQLELDIVTRLQGDSWFSQARSVNGNYIKIPVISEQLGDLDTMALAAVSQANPGTCVIVQVLEWDLQWRNIPGPNIPIEDIQIVLLGIENVQFNRGSISTPSPTGTLIPIKSTMIRCQEMLHNWVPPSMSRALQCGKVSLVERNHGLIQYHAFAQAAGGVFQSVVPQVATPAIVNNSGTVTLSTTTPGAVICYSLNQTFPSPQYGGAGTIYTAPFAVSSGQTLKVNAWLPYWVTSTLVTQSF